MAPCEEVDEGVERSIPGLWKAELFAERVGCWREHPDGVDEEDGWIEVGPGVGPVGEEVRHGCRIEALCEGC